MSRPYVIEDLSGEEIVVTFNKKELQKANQTVFTVEEEVIKRKGDKLYVKWKIRKGYGNPLNS